jgi:hypothetical protein
MLCEAAAIEVEHICKDALRWHGIMRITQLLIIELYAIRHFVDYHY